MALIGITRKKKDGEQAAPLPQPESNEIAMTAGAAKHVIARTEKEGMPGGYLRIAIQGGGCSGLSYVFSIVDGKNEDDLLFTRDDAQVLVDPKSMGVLGGTVLDYDVALGRSGFIVKNPQAASSCSCGESFSL